MRGLLKTTSDALNVLAPAYPELARKSPPRVEEHESWSGVDPARLIDLLENFDGLKQEVQDRMRRIEAVNQAKAFLQEDAIRTEALNRKLAEIGKAFGEVRPELFTREAKNREADLLCMPSREPLAEASPRHFEAFEHPKDNADWIHLQARQKDEALQAATEAKVNFDSAIKQLEQARQVLSGANEALVEMKRLFEQSTTNLNLARSKEETAAADLKSAQQDWTTAYQFATVAAQRQRDAAEFFLRSKRWTINAVATSWIGLVWFAWLPFRALVPIWAPTAATGSVVLLAVLVARRATRRA